MAKDIIQGKAVFDKQKQSQEAQFSRHVYQHGPEKEAFAVGSQGHQL